MMRFFRSLVLLAWMMLALGCQPKAEPPIVVFSKANEPELRLSEVKFQSFRFEGTPQEVIEAVNLAMKQAGFGVGLHVKLTPRKDRAILDLQKVTLRELLDAMCQQLQLSYWDDEVGETLHLQGGLTSSFDVYMRDEYGLFKPAGPRATAPPGYDLLPLRSEYFNRKIQSLEVASREDHKAVDRPSASR